MLIWGPCDPPPPPDCASARGRARSTPPSRPTRSSPPLHQELAWIAPSILIAAYTATEWLAKPPAKAEAEPRPVAGNSAGCSRLKRVGPAGLRRLHPVFPERAAFGAAAQRKAER